MIPDIALLGIVILAYLILIALIASVVGDWIKERLDSRKEANLIESWRVKFNSGFKDRGKRKLFSK